MTITLLGKLLLNCCYCILGQHLSCMVAQDPALLFLVIAPLHISVHNKQSQLEHSNKVQAIINHYQQQDPIGWYHSNSS